jgi:hypothetical protein
MSALAQIASGLRLHQSSRPQRLLRGIVESR